MGPITLENVRASSDITVKLRLKDGGMYIAWTSLADIKAYIFSDVQRAIAGRCDVSIDGDDSTLLICNYSANKPQYLGVNSIVIRANYYGRVKTYDRRAFNIVKRTSSVAGDVVLDDPVVDLELEVADVSSSLLDMAIALAFKAVDEWDQVTVTERGPEGKSAYRVAVDNGFVGTEDEWLESLVGPEGPRGRQGEEGDPGPAGVTSAEVSVDGTSGEPSAQATVENGVLNIQFSGLKGEQGPAGPQGETGAAGAKGDKGDKGDPGETGPQGETGATGATGPKGDTGATPDFSIGTVSTGAAGSQASASITGTAAAPVLNLVIPKGDQGNTGSSVAYPYELVNNRTTNDATKGLTAAEGYRIGQDLTQLEQKVGGLMQAVYDAIGPFAWWEDKPDINFNLNSVLVSLNLTNCTSSNNAFCATLGDSYTTTISPYPGRTMTVVRCWMSGEEVTVTNGVISIAEVTGPVVISAAAVGLDDEAYEGMSYRQLFETNNFLEISPGFENGSFSPMTANAGTPTITTEEKDSGTYSLKVSSRTGDAQLSQQISSASNSKEGGYCACRVKVTEYTQGKAGMQFVASDSVNVEGLCDWTTTAFHRTASSSAVRAFLGSFSNGTLTAYIDTPVVVLDDVFNNLPTLAEWTALYETYVAIKKLS